MATTRIVARIVGRVTGLALAVGLGGAVVGGVEGGVFGAGCATLLGVSETANAYFPHLTDYATTGGGFGASIGVVLGAATGSLAGAIVGAVPRPELRTWKLIRHMLWGCLVWALWCAAGGGLTGAGLNAGSNLMAHLPLWKRVFDLGGGFFFGSVTGFGLGAFGGALMHGLSQGQVSPLALAKRVLALQT